MRSPKLLRTVWILAAMVATAMASDFDLSAQSSYGMNVLRRDGNTVFNLQTFTQALGGIVASPITQSTDLARQFEVNNDTFMDFADAATRSCSNQHNDCANLANSDDAQGFTVEECDTQQTACDSTAASATQTIFPVLTSQDADFEYFCDM